MTSGDIAKRNEFRVGDRLLARYGGTESLQSPKALFSKTVNRLLGTLGVDIGALEHGLRPQALRLARVDPGRLFRSRDLRGGSAVAGNRSSPAAIRWRTR